MLLKYCIHLVKGNWLFMMLAAAAFLVVYLAQSASEFTDQRHAKYNARYHHEEGVEARCLERGFVKFKIFHTQQKAFCLNGGEITRVEY